MKKILLLVAVTLMVVGMDAQEPARVPAYRGVIERVQPNGDTLHTYLRGDERAHWMMMVDGYQIAETQKGWFRYMKRNRKGEAVVSCRKAHNAANRSTCEIKWLNRYGIKKDL